MSRKFLPFILVGGLSISGCATQSTMMAHHADVQPYHESASAPAAYTLAPTAERVDPLEHAIREVRESADMDAALDAYSFGLAIDRNSIALHRAYVRRMVDLGVPHLAVGAAAKVVAGEPDSPLAYAVLAFNAGRDGNMIDALTDISIAAKRAPADPFIQQTSGHLLAWYDNNPRPPGLPSTVRFALQAMHESLDEQQVFADAYNDAADYYHDRQAALAHGPATAPSVGAATEPAVANGPKPEALPPDVTPGYAGGGGMGGTSYGPAVPYEPYTPYYDEPYAFAPGYYGWGPGFLFGAGFAYLSVFDFQHHHHGFDRDHRRDHGGVGDHGKAGDHGGVGDHGGAAQSGGGGRHIGVTGRTGVYLPPPTGPRGVGSAAGRLTGRSSASVTGGFDRLNTGARSNATSSFGSSLPRSNGYRARGTSIDAPSHGFSAARPDGMPSPATTSREFSGSGASVQMPSGSVMGPVPAAPPAAVAPAPAASAAGRLGGRTSGGGSAGGGRANSGGGGAGNGRR